MLSSSFTRSTSARLATPRSSSSSSSSAAASYSSPHFSSSSAAAHRKWWAAPCPYFNVVAMVFLLVSLILVLGCILYLYLFRYFGRGTLVSEFLGSPADPCDVFAGTWVPDASYPIYNSSNCPFAERGFNCLANGRTDTDYLKWRWRPSRCDVPRFSAQLMLERLRGKRVMFVGDSMSRTQWESFICMLMSGVPDLESVYEVNGNTISKTIGFLGVRFRSFNLSVEFFRSVFLVQQGLPPNHGPKRVRTTLKLDRLGEASRKWVDSDVLIFNSGHWWTPTKLFDIGCYFQTGGSLKLGMPITTAFRTALETWASWVERTVNTNRTHVFFRTFEPTHWSDSNQKFCELNQQPTSDIKGNDRSEFVDIIAEVVAKMRAPVTVLNVTSMGASRSDAHIGTWSHPSSILDCSHWCLPGVPDAWNELVFSYLVARGSQKLGR